MKLHGTNNHVESNIKGKSRGFAIEASHKAFKILSDSLYKDKISAAIRELSTNALDAHTEAGNDAPFEVHLPTVLEPIFSVTDHGIGMGQEEVATLYTTYFSSSKSESNDSIGALGLGSKSPFSYTESFNIEAIKNGTKGVYTCFISSEGMPTVQLIEESATDEHNGVSISFAVRESDLRTFVQKAARIYWAFDRKPLISGATTLYNEIVEEMKSGVEVFVENENYTLYKRLPNHFETSYSQKAQVRMGSIIYPISRSMIEQDLTSEEAFVLSNNFVINVDLGVCDIAPSREELNYDEETVLALHSVLAETFAKFTSYIVEEASAQDTAWKAVCFAADILKGVRNVPEFALTYGGQEYTIGESMAVKGLTNRGQVVGIERQRSRVLLEDKYVGKDLKVNPSAAVRFVVCNNEKQLTSYHHRSRIRYFITSNDIHRVVMLVNPTTEDLGKFGNPDIVYFDNLPKVPRNTDTKRVGRGIQPAYTWGDRKEIAVGKLSSYRGTQKKPVVVLKNQAYYPIVNSELGDKYDKDNLSYNLRAHRNAKMVDINRLVVVPYMTWKNNKNLFQKNNWMTIEDYVAEKVTRAIKRLKKSYMVYLESDRALDSYDYLVRGIDVFEAEQFSENSLFRNFITSVKNMKDVKENKGDLATQMEQLMTSGQRTGNRKLINLIHSIKKTDNADQQFDLINRYPMLALLNESWELRRGELNRRSFAQNGGTKARENGEKSVAEVIVQYVNLIDQVA